MKPAPRRLQADHYPMVVSMVPRFGDVNAALHLDNVALMQYFQEAQVQLIASLRGTDGLGPLRTFVAEQTVRYLLEVHYPNPVTVGIGLLGLGTTSLRLGAALFQDGQCRVVYDRVLVCVHASRPTPIPETYRSQLMSWQLRD